MIKVEFEKQTAADIWVGDLQERQLAVITCCPSYIEHFIGRVVMHVGTNILIALDGGIWHNRLDKDFKVRVLAADEKVVLSND